MKTNLTDGHATGSDAAASSTAPFAGAELNRYGWSFADYINRFDHLRGLYDEDAVVSDTVVREWWQLGTGPIEAARHDANGIRPEQMGR